MKKHFRLLSIFLVLILSFSLFSVNAYASDTENLVDSNMSNWVDCGETLDAFQTADISSNGTNNIITVERNTKGIVILYDLTEFLKVGESYQFSFTLPNTNSTGLNYYSLGWTLANSVDGPVAAESRELVYVKNSNKSNYLGKTTTFEFTYTEGYKNTCIALYIWGNDDLSEFPLTTFYINDVSLIRVVTESEKKLDGILGWLESIWDSITSLGDKLTDVWTNITSSVSSLGDRISGFFENLINNVKTFFEELPSKIFNYEIEVNDDDIINGGNGEEIPKSLYYEFDFSELDLTNYSNSGSSYLYAELLSDNTLYIRGPTTTSAYKSFDFSTIIPSSNFETLKTYTLEFTVTNFQYTSATFSKYNCFNFSLPNEKILEQKIASNSTFKYNFTLDSSSSDFIIDSLDVARHYSLCISNLKVYEVVEGGSSGDTGSGNEGNTTKISWFQFIINKFNGWFTELGNRIINYILYFDDEIPENPFTGVDSPLDHVQGFFDDLIDYLTGIGDDIETVLDSITAPVSLLDTFTKRFEWLFGIVTFTLMMIVVSRFIGL